MKIFYCIFYFICLHSIAKSQTIDSTLVKCKYSFSFQRDSLNSLNKGNDLMVLEIGKETSIFYSEFRRIGDSLLRGDESKGIKNDPIAIQNDKYHFNNWSLILARNYPKGKITVSEIIFQVYKYTEPLTLQDWKITSDTLTISGMICQKATTNFRGRNYEAWFSRSIPIPFGPWKFYGLPGLIVKIGDTKREFLFELVGLETLAIKQPMILYEEKNTIIASRLDVWKLKKQKAEDPFGFLQNSTGLKITVTTPMTDAERKSRKTPFNPIELN